MKRAAPGRAQALLRGVLGLLVAVVALLCVFGHAEHGGPVTPPSTAERASVAVAAVAEPSDDAEAPCRKKAIGDHSVQRAENPPPSAPLPRALSPHTEPAPLVPQHSGTTAGGPDPPPSTLHSVLRI
ncbi:hypothetical protein KBY91_29040 [Streptomyces sp. RK23]|uniref:hypothetical protein n=1 Tax=Streptomyces TaxID=1883 RepID=UPI001B371587|nr:MULTISPECIES: hypothetical protein [unclassified Streptomyces]MBQ0964500.1 hypothetical protein [Streptomyces sp. RK74B]MBQ1007459.1 hypothetical protein [Streptomyces sp. RK23]